MFGVGGMRCHLARLLERAAVLAIGRDAGGADGVVAHLGGNVGGPARRRSIP